MLSKAPLKSSEHTQTGLPAHSVYTGMSLAVACVSINVRPVSPQCLLVESIVCNRGLMRFIMIRERSLIYTLRSHLLF
jgi:hypothetical protein